MRQFFYITCVAAILTIAPGSFADTLALNPQDLRELLRTLHAPAATEPMRIYQENNGFVKFLGAPEGGGFQTESTSAKNAAAESIAQEFISQHGKAFGVLSSQVTFTPETASTGKSSGRAVRRYNQYYKGLPVFGAQIVIGTNADNLVDYVLSDIMRDTRALDEGQVPLTPGISSQEALALGKNKIAANYEGVSAADLTTAQTPILTVYRPQVLSLNGPTRLVWNMIIGGGTTDRILETVLCDAATGEVVLHYSRIPHATKFRKIIDTEETLTSNDFYLENVEINDYTPARIEGDAATGIADVDDAYDFLGDTYDFYLNNHDRDSIDDAGMAMIGIVRLQDENAFWGSTTVSGNMFNAMMFGEGWVADDVTAHELTHGVTSFTSDLEYIGFSGAINESFSDIWGEFVDLTNDAGDDSAAARWFMGEDLSINGGVYGGAIRSMSDPTLFGDPDSLDSPLVIPPDLWWFDNGGVHINSGIANKLCYLLTDGDTFNGKTITGMGIEKTAKLFYHIQQPEKGEDSLLPVNADFYDLYFALGEAASDLDYTFGEKMNVFRAAQAVAIVPENITNATNLDFQAVSTRDTDGAPVVSLSWTPPSNDDFSSITLVRSLNYFPTGLNDGIIIHSAANTDFEGTDRFLDVDIIDGERYYYTLFVDSNTGFPLVSYALATGGDEPPVIATELFGTDKVYDLAYSQVIFRPVGAPLSAAGQGTISGGYQLYETLFIPEKLSFDVPREDENGAAFLIPMTDDDPIGFTFASPFPFFQEAHSTFYLSPNGFISFGERPSFATSFATLDNHFSTPRLSFLLTDLAPNANGEVWMRYLNDKVVVTFESVPAWYVPFTNNSVQVEMFYSGEIRITWQTVGIEFHSEIPVIVGLSNGTGIPKDPANLFDNVISSPTSVDFSALNTTPEKFSFQPIAPVFVDAGDRVQIDVTALIPDNATGSIALSANWTGPIPIAQAFVDQGNGTGILSWQTTTEDAGTYTVQFIVKQDGDAVAYQDVRVYVLPVELPPLALNLAVSSGIATEDPTESRQVATERALRASYTYSHPQIAENPFGFAEGDSTIYWLKNNQVIPTLTNSLSVAPAFTKSNDEWYFLVIPRTVSGIAGDPVQSPIIRIDGTPEILALSPGQGSAAGGETIRIKGNRLFGALKVTFDGLFAQSVRSISDTELEVVTPVHWGGFADVVVETSSGSGILEDGFIFIAESDKFHPADLNKDGKVDSRDIQIVTNAVLALNAKSNALDPDANQDGNVNAADIQTVVNAALHR